ncbi:hypothetical protein [Youngiibacter multivorans]|uniref:Uncharacterized protein n=1 Tax=Youngiibacter multivorans TaxID=937251 RepID=A0ABS4G6X9_9CLOT|nr:hypothetical protein [Youngiibacter multivorans]MBP1920288.1 hypothetical protein [Youngiibacter multivorans]
MEYGDLIEISSIHINELKGSSKEDKSKLSPQGKKLLTIIESSKSERYKNLINVEVSSALKRKMNKISEEHDGESLLAELSKVE